MRGLSGQVPTAAPALAEVVGNVPPAGPVDCVTVRRLRRAIGDHLGEVPNLDAHLGLLDARGAWYGWHTVAAWDPAQGEAFFGLIRHAVRTLFPGPAPAPDIEGWLAGGRPSRAALAGTWTRVLEARYPGRTVGSLPFPITVRPAGVHHHVDMIVAGWPELGLDGFIHSYATLEATVDVHGITLPDIGA